MKKPVLPAPTNSQSQRLRKDIGNYSMTIFELTSEYLQLLDMLEDPDMDEQTILDTLEGVGGELEEKADGYARVMRQMDADAAAIKAEEERLHNRRKSLENRSAWLKSRLQNVMELTGKTKFKTELFSFGIQNNPPKVVIDDPSRIYEDYLIEQEPKVDTAAIRNALKDPEEAALWDGIAHLEQSESLRIR